MNALVLPIIVPMFTAAVLLLALTACGGQELLPTGSWGESNWSEVRWGP